MNQHSYLVGLIAPGAEFSVSSELHRREAARHELRYLCSKTWAANAISAPC